jgi:hypothetical protein
MWHCFWVDRHPVFRTAGDGRRGVDIVDLVGVEPKKRLLVAEPRYCHINSFSVTEGLSTDWQLWRIGIAFERVDLFPCLSVGQSVGRLAVVFEVRNPAVGREGKPG